MTNVSRIEGKTFIITGGANGLGAAYVEAFSKEGAKNIAILDVDEEAGKLLAKRIYKTYNNKVIFMKCDVSAEEDIQRAFDEVLQTFQQVDVIVNNAGILNDSEQVWRKSCEVNCQGLISFTRKGVSHMRKDRGGAGGTIINISSTIAIMRLPFLPTYSATKAAVLHFSLSLSVDPFYENTGVRVLTICYGPTNTALMQNVTQKIVDKKAAPESFQMDTDSICQTVENAVAGMLKMFKAGSSGSVWLATYGRPAEDITHVLDNAYEQYNNVVLNGLQTKGTDK